MDDNIPSSTFDKKRFFISLLISSLISTLLCGLFILIQVLAGRKWSTDTLLIWVNALTVGGGMMVLFYFLVLLSNGGALDALSYSIKLVWYNTFHRSVRKTKLAANYYEYKVERQKKKRDVNEIYILLGGLPYLVVGLLLLIPLYC